MSVGARRGPGNSSTKSNRTRLAKELQNFREDDFLEEQQKKFDMLMLDKKAKEAIRKSERTKAMKNIKSLGSNAPLSKYYREQISGGDTQTTLGTG